MNPFVFILFICLVLRVSASKFKDDLHEHVGQCKFIETANFHSKESLNPKAISPQCHVSLFSHYSFSLNGKFVMMDGDLCSKDLESVNFPAISKVLRKEQVILGVKRGTCPFDEKSRTAHKFGAVGLIIFNHEASFPVGSSTDDFVSPIPVLMMEWSAENDKIKDFAESSTFTATFGEHLTGLNNL